MNKSQTRKMLIWVVSFIIAIFSFIYSIYRIPSGEHLIISGGLDKTSSEGNQTFRYEFERIMGNQTVWYFTESRLFILYVNKKDNDAIWKHHNKCTVIAINAKGGYGRFTKECKNEANFRVQPL